MCPPCLQYECENVLADSALLDACGAGLGRQEMYGAMLACKRIGEDPKLGVATVRFFGKVGRHAPGAGHLCAIHAHLAGSLCLDDCQPTAHLVLPQPCCTCFAITDIKLYVLTLPYQQAESSPCQPVLQLPCFMRQACSQVAGVERLSAGPQYSCLLVMLGISQSASAAAALVAGVVYWCNMVSGCRC